MSSRLNLFLALALLVGGSLPAAVFAQGPGGPGGRGGFGMFGGGGGGGDLMLLQNDDVRTELGLVDDQVEKIRGIGEKMREEMRSMFSGFRDLGEEERRAKFEEMRTKMEDRAKEVQKEMDEILLPHQSKRLKQIGRQLRSRQGGNNGVSPDAVATELKLSDEQKEKLREKAQEVEKKLREKVAKMRKEAEDDLLSVLTPEQRAEWRDLIGEPFEMQFRGFGGRGGPGGQGGPGGPGGRGNPQGN